jgi:hypothetical protein
MTAIEDKDAQFLVSLNPLHPSFYALSNFFLQEFAGDHGWS